MIYDSQQTIPGANWLGQRDWPQRDSQRQYQQTPISHQDLVQIRVWSSAPSGPPLLEPLKHQRQARDPQMGKSHRPKPNSCHCVFRVHYHVQEEPKKFMLPSLAVSFLWIRESSNISCGPALRRAGVPTHLLCWWRARNWKGWGCSEVHSSALLWRSLWNTSRQKVKLKDQTPKQAQRAGDNIHLTWETLSAELSWEGSLPAGCAPPKKNPPKSTKNWAQASLHWLCLWHCHALSWGTGSSTSRFAPRHGSNAILFDRPTLSCALDGPSWKHRLGSLLDPCYLE